MSALSSPHGPAPGATRAAPAAAAASAGGGGGGGYRFIYPPDAAAADAELREIVARRGSESETVVDDGETPPVVSTPSVRRSSYMSRAQSSPAQLVTTMRIGGMRMSVVQDRVAHDAPGPPIPVMDAAVVERNRPEHLARRRLQEEYHRRPRVVLDKAPLLITVSVLDREHWAGGLLGLAAYFLSCGCASKKMPPALAMRLSGGAAPPTTTGATCPSERVRQEQNRLILSNMTPENANLDDILAMGNYTMRNTSTQPRARHGAAQQPTNITATTTNPFAYPGPSPSIFFDDGHGDAPLEQGSWDPTSSAVEVRGGRHDQRSASRPSSSSSSCVPLNYLCHRLCCTRCTVAHQTALLFEEEQQRRRFPARFCCECLLGEEGHYGRSLAVMLVMDALSLGWCPFGCCYMGCGTLWYTWRLRYLVRLRYRIKGLAWWDLVAASCCAVCAVDQLTSEMATHGLPEDTLLPDVARVVQMS